MLYCIFRLLCLSLDGCLCHSDAEVGAVGVSRAFHGKLAVCLLKFKRLAAVHPTAKKLQIFLLYRYDPALGRRTDIQKQICILFV